MAAVILVGDLIGIGIDYSAIPVGLVSAVMVRRWIGATVAVLRGRSSTG